MSSNLYETDFYAWTLEQSKLLKNGDFKDLDIINLMEEIESLGKQERRELDNRYAYNNERPHQSLNYQTPAAVHFKQP